MLHTVFGGEGGGKDISKDKENGRDVWVSSFSGTLVSNVWWKYILSFEDSISQDITLSSRLVFEYFLFFLKNVYNIFCSQFPLLHFLQDSPHLTTHPPSLSPSLEKKQAN